MLEDIETKASELLKDEKVKEAVDKVKEFASTDKGKEVIENVKEKVSEFVAKK